MKNLFLPLLFVSFCGQAQINLSVEKPNLANGTWENRQYMRAKDYSSMRNSKGLVNPDVARWDEWEKIRSRGSAKTSQAVNVWSNFGPHVVSGRIISIAFHPVDSNIIYAGAAGGGLWKTTDLGQTWKPLTDMIPSLAIGAVALNPKNPNTVLIATGEGYNIGNEFTTGVGVLISYDAGKTFSATSLTANLSQNFAGMDIVWNSRDTTKVCVASSFGVYYSGDGGKNYTYTLNRLAARMMADPKHPDTVYVTGRYYNSTYPGGFYRSVNGGQTWTQYTTGLPVPNDFGYSSFSIHPVYDNILFLNISQSSVNGLGPSVGLYRSRNYGVTWSKITTNLDIQCYHPPYNNICQGWYANTICVAPNDTNLLFAGGCRFWKSTNGGYFWKYCDTVSTGGYYAVHPDYHQTLYHPLTKALFVCDDGGVNFTRNNGDTWTSLAQGLITHQFYKIAFAETDPDVVIGGAQDVGNFTSVQAHTSTNWTNEFSGDAFGCTIDFTDKDTWYMSNFMNLLRIKTSNAGFNWAQINTGANTDQWRMPIVMHPKNPNVLLSSGNNNIYKTINGGATWFSTAGTGFIGCFEFDKVNNNLVYATTLYTGTLYRSSTGGVSWFQQTASPSSPITGMAADPVKKGTVYASIGSFGTQDQVYRSIDSGLTWVNISANLPAVPANTIAVDPFDNQNIYVGTDLGVWVTTDGGLTWSDYNNGSLPYVVVEDLHYYKPDSTIRVGTYGRGYWRAKALPPTPNGIQLEKNHAAPELYLYPNPAEKGEDLVLRIGSLRAQEGTIQVRNAMGQLVNSMQVNLPAATSTVKFSAPPTGGIYFISLETPSGIRTVKLLVAD